MGIIRNGLIGGVQNAARGNISLSQFDQQFDNHFWPERNSIAGVPVNEDSALRNTAVWGCTMGISEDVGMLPFEVRKWRDVRNKSKGYDLALDHPLFDLFMFQPDPVENIKTHSMTFRQTMQHHTLTSGNGYAAIHMDFAGRITRLQLLDWRDVALARNKDTKKLEWIFDDNGTPQIIPYDRLFQLAGLGFDGLRGYSPIRMAMEAVGLGLAAEHFASYFYANGANMGGMITTPKTIRDKKSLSDEFNEKFKGIGNSHKVIFLEEGMEFKKLVMPLKEAQFIETRRFQVEEVARVYRYPMHMLQELTDANYSNIEAQDLGYTKRVVLPWSTRWEKAVSTQLLTRREREQGFHVKTDLDEILRAEQKTRAEIMHLKRQDGVVTGNEVRASDNQNPSDQPEADELYINGNMVKLSDAGKVPTGGGGDSNE